MGWYVVGNLVILRDFQLGSAKLLSSYHEKLISMAGHGDTLSSQVIIKK